MGSSKKIIVLEQNLPYKCVHCITITLCRQMDWGLMSNKTKVQMFDSYYGKLNEMSLGNAHTMSFCVIAHTM